MPLWSVLFGHEVNGFEWDPEAERGLKLAPVLVQDTLLLEPVDVAELTMRTVSHKNRELRQFPGGQMQCKHTGVGKKIMVLFHRKLFL